MDKTSYIPHKDGRIVARGKLQIILPDEHLIELQNETQKNLAQIAANDSDYKLTCAEFQAEIDRLVSIAKNIVDPATNINIFNYIPLTKSGEFFKDRNILIADSKCVIQGNYGYPVNQHIQLRLVPAYCNVNQWLQDNRIENMKCLAIRLYDAVKKQAPVFDRNGQPHAIMPTAKATYLKDDEIRPGHLYEEKSGSKYLYLTGMPVTQQRVWHRDDASEPHDERPALEAPDHWYLRWSDAIEKKCKGDTSFNNIMRVMAASEKDTQLSRRLSCRENPRKFVSHVKQLFDPEAIRPETIQSKPHVTWEMTDVKVSTVYRIKGG